MARRLPWLFVLLAGLVVAAFVHVAGGLDGLGIRRGSGGPDDQDLLGADGEDLARDPVRLGGRGGALRKATGGTGRGEAGGAGRRAGRGHGAEGAEGVVVPFGGLVKDSSGRAVEGAKVTLQGYGTAQMLETSREGRFGAEIRPGRYNLLFDSLVHGGLAMRAYMVDGAAGRETEFVLREAVRFEATILQDGTGVPDAEVTLKPDVGIGQRTARTDALGLALFERVVSGSYRLVAETPGGASLSKRMRLLKDGEAMLSFPPGVAVEGTVKDAESGAAVADARVRAHARGKGGVWLTVTGTTGADGRYAVQVPRGPIVRFGVSADGYAPWPPRAKNRSVLRALSPVAKGQSAAQDVELTQGLRLEGRVTDEDGNPVEGVDLRFRPSRGGPLVARTGEDGLYELEGIDAQRYAVVVMSEGWFSEKPLKLSVPHLEPGAVHHYDIRVRATLAVEGFVYYAKDKPATGARVWVTGGGKLVKSARGAGRQLETFTDSAGWWRLTDLPADRSVVLRASVGTLQARPRGVNTSALPDQAIQLKLQPTVTVRGRVFDLVQRQVVPLARVRISPRGAPGGRTTRTVRTDKEGDYVAFELLPGGWSFTPLHASYLATEPREETFDKDDEEVEVDLRLDPGLALGGVVSDTEGRRVAKAWVNVDGVGPDGKRLRRSGRTDAGGRFRLTGFSRGVYRVTAGGSGYRRARLQGIPAGSEELQVTLRASARRTR